jgi:hypothetical protein
MWQWLRRVAHTSGQGTETAAPHPELLIRYQHLRRVGLRLNSRLVKTVPKSVLDEGGKKLGILKRNVLILDTEDEIAVLMDFCIYDVRRQGANAVEHFVADSPPPPGSDEMVLLQAMRQARYSLFAVEAVERGVGVHVRDLLRDEILFVVDVALSETAPLGMIMAGRVMAPDGIAMTTGTALPVGVLPPAARTKLVEGLVRTLKVADYGRLSPEEASALTATVIRRCLQGGAAAHIAYGEPKTGRGPGRGRAALAPARPVGRNDPCPCGSGKKVKHCCGHRR